MDKRFQVFVSSTYEDLKAERQRVIQTVLEFDCIPVGMEFFPAANDTQWEVMKKVIAECDYYVVIVAGRYGSLSPEGLSYTRKEYEYAVERKIPVIAFLHGDPGKIPFEKSEASEENQLKLSQFREICEKRLCKYWRTPEELGTAVITSLNNLIQTHPAFGWVRGNHLLTAAKEIERLNEEINDLKAELETLRTPPPIETERLAAGEELFTVHFSVYDGKGVQVQESFAISWNEMFAFLAPYMPDTITQSGIGIRIGQLIGIKAPEIWHKNWRKILRKRKPPFSGHLEEQDIITIRVHLCALGLIKHDPRSRDWEDGWVLTPLGKTTMHNVRAVPKKVGPSG